MPDHPRILPLVTDAGPVCRIGCPQLVCVTPRGWLRCLLDPNDHPADTGDECLPALREAWLREQGRARQTCGTCTHWDRDDAAVGPARRWCTQLVGGEMTTGEDESCSRWERRG